MLFFDTFINCYINNNTNIRFVGVLSEGYFRELAQDLRNLEWLQLATALGVDDVAKERIKQKHRPHLTEAIVAMLTEWYKKARMSEDKVNQL